MGMFPRILIFCIFHVVFVIDGSLSVWNAYSILPSVKTSDERAEKRKLEPTQSQNREQ